MLPRHSHGTPPPSGRDLAPLDVLTDLFDSEDATGWMGFLPVDFPKETAEIVVQRLIDAGFEIRPLAAITQATYPDTAGEPRQTVER